MNGAKFRILDAAQDLKNQTGESTDLHIDIRGLVISFNFFSRKNWHDIHSP